MPAPPHLIVIYKEVEVDKIKVDCTMTDNSLAEEGFEGSQLFDFMRSVVEDDPELKKKSIQKVNAVTVITLKNAKGNTKSWLLDFKKSGEVTKLEGKPPKAELQLQMRDVDFIKLINNEANPQRMYMAGKLKIKGNIVKAASIEPFLRSVDPREKAKL